MNDSGIVIEKVSYVGIVQYWGGDHWYEGQENSNKYNSIENAQRVVSFLFANNWVWLGETVQYNYLSELHSH